jgi:hypothetical protein
MNDKTEELLTELINKLGAAGKNHQEISTDLMGGAVAVLVESIGPAETANFLHAFADKVVETPELGNVIN